MHFYASGKDTLKLMCNMYVCYVLKMHAIPFL